MSNQVIDIESLSFKIGTSTILEDISIQFSQGDFVAIFGPNGGGKTTFLKLLLGFLKPSSGCIRILGMHPQEARIHIGYVPQITRFDRKFPLSVLEVVSMGLLKELSWFGKWNHQTKKKAIEALELVGLSSLCNQPFSSLSGGQAQRVLLARALANDPKLLFLDEPTASVDPEAEAEIHRLLLTREKSVTVLMVTHDLQTIMSDVDRMLFIQRRAEVLSKEQVCGHFAMGLYHTPLREELRVID
jgi:zinc transport system ATP-binding protein